MNHIPSPRIRVMVRASYSIFVVYSLDSCSKMAMLHQNEFQRSAQ